MMAIANQQVAEEADEIIEPLPPRAARVGHAFVTTNSRDYQVARTEVMMSVYNKLQQRLNDEQNEELQLYRNLITSKDDCFHDTGWAEAGAEG